MATVANLVLVDTHQGVVLARDRYGDSDARVALVALSAEACEAADALGVDCRPISAVVQFGQRMLWPQREAFAPWLRALVEIEGVLAGELPGCRFDGLGILTSQTYQVALAINAIRQRTGLMIAATAALGPSEVTLIETRLEPWFAGADYAFNPWTLAFQGWLESRGIRVNMVSSAANRQQVGRSPLPVAQSLYSAGRAWASKRPFLRRAQRALAALGSGWASRRRSDELSDVRILFSDTAGVVWAPVCQYLNERGARLYLLERNLLDPLATYFTELNTNREGVIGLPETASTVPADESAQIAAVFDRWAERMPARSTLCFGGIDTFAALKPYVRALAMRGPALFRKTDRIVAAALDFAKPRAACFFAIAHAYQKRLAFACARRNIPVVCYQHGGAYGTHVVPVHDFIENAYADHFLVHGRGILPPNAPLIPARAAYVPVGSARLEALRLDSANALPALRNKSELHVVWAGDFSMRNGIGAGTEVEDTARYRLETECLSIISRSKVLRVTYRPFPGEMAAQATPSWLRRNDLANVVINTHSKMIDLLRRADLLVTISTSGTLWNEALAIGLPLIAYANPAYTQLRPAFVETLNTACLLCRSDEELQDMMEFLARDGAAFLARFANKAREPFLRDYVIHEGDCVSRASEYMTEVCRSSPANLGKHPLQSDRAQAASGDSMDIE